MLKHEKLFVDVDVLDREAVCKRLTENGATLVDVVGEQDSIHIFKSFTGETYEECVKKGLRIIGLPCLEDSLQSGKALPRASHPIYSRVMEGLVISGDVVEEKAKLKNYVNQMNGTWSDELTGNTQYFIATEPGSMHYLWALEFGSNIVQPSWIIESWQNCSLSNPKLHLLPPFSGCIISVTGLSTSTRASVQHLVTHYGGKYSQQLSRKVTHLLCDKAKGRKYFTALAWGVHVVTTNWLFDSINMKGVADVSRYELTSLPDLESGSVGGSTTGSGAGGDALYLRSPYSRSNNPYAILSAASRQRSNYTAPILVRRHRNQSGTNYSPVFSLPSAHPQQHISSNSHQPVFAQTTQIQTGPSSQSSSALSTLNAMRQLPLPLHKFPSSRQLARDRESRANMDKYKDMADQLHVLLRKCDQVIDMCTPFYNVSESPNTGFNTLVLTSSINNNIDTLNNLYQELNNVCNHITVADSDDSLLDKPSLDTNSIPSPTAPTPKKSSNKLPSPNTTSSQPPADTTTTTTTSTTPSTSTTTPTTTTTVTPIPAKPHEESTDVEMDSDEDTTVTTSSSDQEK